MFGAAAAREQADKEVELTDRDALLYRHCLKKAFESCPMIDSSLPSVKDHMEFQVENYMDQGYGHLGIDELVRHHGKSPRHNLKSLLTSLWLATMATENAAKGIQKPTLEEVALVAKGRSRHEIRRIEETVRRACDADS